MLLCKIKLERIPKFPLSDQVKTKQRVEECEMPTERETKRGDESCENCRQPNHVAAPADVSSK